MYICIINNKIYFLMGKQSNIQTKGEVIEALSNSRFKVTLDCGNDIICCLSGKIRMHHIKILPGDKVGVEMSPYDLTKGRIYLRLR